MVTEEIGLNRALAAAGISAVETDLGEFIVQLRGEPPAHITTPAIHLRREDVGRTFESHLGLPYTTEVEAMTAAVRRVLRSEFLQAPAGISGVNFAVADTGTLCLVTNEGNGRMVTTLPPLHIAVMGAERVVESLADLSVMLEVLSRAGTGQRRTSYVSLLQGPRQEADTDGPIERHVVVVDNGRLALRSSPLAESLACIRCGACLNACPVYQEIGGHAYGSVYPGPIGSVVSPGLWGTDAFGHLATASTLCAACREACPVGIDLPAMLLRVRADRVQHGAPPPWMRAGMGILASVFAGPGRFAAALRTAAVLSQLVPKRDGWIRWLPPPMGRWTQTRDFPPFAWRPFRARWAELARDDSGDQGDSAAAVHAPAPDTQTGAKSHDLRSRFIAAASETGYAVVECSRDQVMDEVARVLGQEGAVEVLTSGSVSRDWEPILERLESRGIRTFEGGPALEGAASLERAAAARVGLTGAVAGLADVGTLVLPSGEGRSLCASLLPPVHLAILDERDLHDSLEAWLATDGGRWVAQEAAVVLVTGPSRTADIEMTLTIGVHGPRRVVVFLVGD
jgi:L-lactate dehydrogenase complex protein LldF